MELTPAGLRTLAAHLGLSLASAVSRHGLAGGGPESPIGTRRTLSWPTWTTPSEPTQSSAYWRAQRACNVAVRWWSGATQPPALMGG